MPYHPTLKEIDTYQGKLIIRPDMMVGTISKYFDPSLYEPRQFAILFLHDIIYSPEFTVQQISEWDDATIEQVLNIWLNEQTEEIWQLSDGVSLFEGFQNSYREYVLRHSRQMQEIIEKSYAPAFTSIGEILQQQAARYERLYEQISASFTVSLEPLFKSIDESISLMANSVVGSINSNISKLFEVPMFPVPIIDLGGFFENLPDLSTILERVPKYDETVTAITDVGYPPPNYYWTISNIHKFVGVEHIDHRVRPAAITNRLLAYIRQDSFTNEMRIQIQGSQVLSRRWRVIEQALIAHRNRHYAISIPTLLAQIEGIFTDALVLKGAVKQDKGKLYARDLSGALKVNKKGDPIELHGLGQKVQHSDLQDEPLLRDLARFFTDYLVKGRNDIMHGRIVNYDKAKLSVQLLLYTYLLAAEFVDFESEH